MKTKKEIQDEINLLSVRIEKTALNSHRGPYDLDILMAQREILGWVIAEDEDWVLTDDSVEGSIANK